jgi:hypothetical protein
LGYYAASSGNSLPTFQGNLSVPSTRFKNPIFSNVLGHPVSPKLSVRNYHYLLHSNPIECCSHLLHGRSVKSYNTNGFVSVIYKLREGRYRGCKVVTLPGWAMTVGSMLSTFQDRLLFLLTGVKRFKNF